MPKIVKLKDIGKEIKEDLPKFKSILLSNKWVEDKYPREDYDNIMDIGNGEWVCWDTGDEVAVVCSTKKLY